MNLGLIDGPFVPHNLISALDSPVPLPKFQMAPRFKILMSSGSKNGTQIYCPFLSKVPAVEFPPGSPKGAPMERNTRLQGIFTSLLIYLFNISFRSKWAFLPGSPHGVRSERDAPGGKDGRCVGLTTLLLLYSDCLEILVFSTFWSPKGLSRPEMWHAYLFLYGLQCCFSFTNRHDVTLGLKPSCVRTSKRYSEYFSRMYSVTCYIIC